MRQYPISGNIATRFRYLQEMRATKEKGFSILIADEDLEFHDKVKLLIRNFNINVVVASVFNGQQLLDFIFKKEMYKSDFRRPDVIIMDLNMRLRGGLEVVAEIKGMEGYKRTPLFILTRYATEEQADLAIELGVSGFYRKPEDPGRLTEIIDEICFKILRQNERNGTRPDRQQLVLRCL